MSEHNTPLRPPLAYLLAPNELNEYVGQRHLLGPDKPLQKMIASDHVMSMIFWGPPGCGKTGLAKLISKSTQSAFLCLNAVSAKISDIHRIIDQAKSYLHLNKRTIVFIDEIHRFNKVQQDALLPDVENGLITFIGATTENPFFSVIPGLISRAQVFELFGLLEDDLLSLIEKSVTHLNKISPFTLEQGLKNQLIGFSKGDGRKLITLIEALHKISSTPSLSDLTALTQTHGTPYNKDQHYDLISAYIKSMRGSDVNAALYWLARLLHDGEDPVFITRRLIIFASEDIGNADPHALPLATALIQAVKEIGMPEIQINLGHVTSYLALAKKSNAAYMGIKKAMKCVQNGTVYPVPNHLRDSHYASAKKAGFGKDYVYPHNDTTDQAKKQNYLPKQHLFYNE